MLELINKTAVAYLSAFEFHAKTIAVCWESHKASEDTYNELFEVLHSTIEKHYSLNIPKDDKETMQEDLYATIDSLCNDYKKAITEEKDEGVKNVLIQNYDSLQTVRAKFRSVMEVE